jgi:hypothetical protein
MSPLRYLEQFQFGRAHTTKLAFMRHASLRSLRGGLQHPLQSKQAQLE